MEDNDKRNSSVPSASTGDGPDSKSDLFDPHEATLPRFTIDPGEAAPLRQRTRTLLGVPTLVTEDAQRAPAPPTSASQGFQEVPEPTVASGRLTGSIPAPEAQPASQASDQAFDAANVLDMTIDVVEDELNDVTMVSDADVVALPDNTGQLQPVRFDAVATSEPVANRANDEATATAAAFAATAPNQSSLAPREITRPAAAPQPTRDSSGSGWGALLVAAVMLLATGAWFLTAGTFRRATLSSESTTAAATQPSNNVAADKTEKVVPPAPAPSEAVSATPTTPTTPAPVATTTAQAPASDDVAAPGPGLKNKPALTASVRGERVRRSSRKVSAAPAPIGEVAQGPTRAEVVTRLESVRPAVHACAAGRSGVADLDITIAHTGVVMHVLVGGDFAGTTEGSCIARAVRQARFPAFKQERFRLLYPYAM